MNKTKELRSLPGVDEMLRHDALAGLRASHPHCHLAAWIRDAIAEVRQRILADDERPREATEDQVLRLVTEFQQRDATQSIHEVINATGVLLHTNLGRAPLAPQAVARMGEASRFTNLELELDTGKRSRRGDRAIRLLSELTGSEDAIVVNNCAAATLLTLQAIASGREVVISRGQLVEIGGGFRLPEVFAAAGVTLREIGTTNRTYARDYEAAIGEQTGAIIRVHRSNFAQTGFVAEPTLDELVTLARLRRIPFIDDLGSGLVTDISRFGIVEPTVQERIRGGADLCLFSGDKLFGGPQCGIVVGRSRWIQQLRQHPMMRALRTDKMTLAALEATTEIHLGNKAFEQLPLYQMLSISPDEIEQRVTAVIRQSQLEGQASIVACKAQIGGGSLPGVDLPSFGIAVPAKSTDRLSAILRNGQPAILGRQIEDQVLLDLRTVMPNQLDQLAQRLPAAVTADRA